LYLVKSHDERTEFEAVKSAFFHFETKCLEESSTIKLTIRINDTKNRTQGEKMKNVVNHKIVRLLTSGGLAIILSLSGCSQAAVEEKEPTITETSKSKTETVKKETESGVDKNTPEAEVKDEKESETTTNKEQSSVSKTETASTSSTKKQESTGSSISVSSSTTQTKNESVSNSSDKTVSENKTPASTQASSTTSTTSTSSTHTHTWKEQFKSVKHEEQGHYETVTVKEAWTETVSVYGTQTSYVCNDCGRSFTYSAIWDHIFDEAANGGKGSYSDVTTTVQTGTQTIQHEAQTEKKYVVDQEAYTEKVSTGYQCTSCGATK
jgi:hypothetical protein